MSDYNLDYIINTNSFVKEIIYYEEVGSTNDIAKETLKKTNLKTNNFLVLANSQTNGRGKGNSKFFSPANAGVYMSIVLLKPLCDLKLISIVTSLAILRSIKAFVNTIVKIKLPNDILANNKKVCGILIEACTQPSKFGIEHVIIGIGININNDKFNSDIESIATSLKKESGKIIDRNLLIVKILNALKILFSRDAKDLFNEYLKNLDEKSLCKVSKHNISQVFCCAE